MARVRSLVLGDSDLLPHRTEVDCTYQIVGADDGSRLLQLSTYGSDSRKSGPKVSQTLQIDEGTAAELVEIIRRAFPSIH
ncbi:hypothetical protein DQ226_17360 [Dietzia maris]|uniref:Methionyl-tRNA formyltransferase n=1 Tax=Dietzia maris TaxID=37915 RepID=A0A365P6D3_9ACTN|nr:hypothetical protein DQ226_17360 [Dietzia maris]